MKNIFANIEYCREHQNLYLMDCAYCLLDRRMSPVVNLDDLEANCKVCGHEHDEVCECSCPAVKTPLTKEE